MEEKLPEKTADEHQSCELQVINTGELVVEKQQRKSELGGER